MIDPLFGEAFLVNIKGKVYFSPYRLVSISFRPMQFEFPSFNLAVLKEFKLGI